MSTVIRIVREIQELPFAASWGVIVEGLIVTENDLAKASQELLHSYARPNAKVEHKTQHEYVYREGRELWSFSVDLEHPVTVNNRRFYGIETK